MATGGRRGSLVPATASRRPRPWPGAGGRLLVPLVLAISLLSCGIGPAGHRLTAGPCPARAPVAALPAPAGRSPAAPLIRPDPVIAVICQYVVGLPAPKRRLTPVLRVVLPSAAADGLAALLDDARPLPPAARRCASFPFSQLIEFGYRAGPGARAAVTFCSSGAEVTSGRRSASFGPPRGHIWPTMGELRLAAQRRPVLLHLNAPTGPRAPHARPDRAARRRRGIAPFQPERHRRYAGGPGLRPAEAMAWRSLPAPGPCWWELTCPPEQWAGPARPGGWGAAAGFRVGDLAATRLGAGPGDAVLCVDAIHFAS